MMTLRVNISPSDAARVVEDYVLRSGMSNERAGSYHNQSPEGREAIMMVFEKYYMRNSSRASLSVMIENMEGPTNVCVVGSGGGQGTFLRFDWGASDNFEQLVEKALRAYV